MTIISLGITWANHQIKLPFSVMRLANLTVNDEIFMPRRPKARYDKLEERNPDCNGITISIFLNRCIF